MTLSSTSTLPWVEKYRPKTLNDVISHNAIIHTIHQFISAKQLPHLLFHGPPGTGKTSVAQAIARELYGDYVRHMTLELNASDDRGIQVVRDTIKQFSETRPSQPSRNVISFASSSEETPQNHYIKLVILDEADQMTGAAQMALRRIIEMYAAHVRFLIICNYVNKISPALQSRCTKFRFSPLSEDALRVRTKHICDLEGLELTEDALDALLRIGSGDLRKVLNCVQSCGMGKKSQVVDEKLILETVGRPCSLELTKLIPQLTTRKFPECFQILEKLLREKGFSLSDIIIEIYEKMIQHTLPLSATCIFYPRLAEIQYRLARGADELSEAADLVALFISIRKDVGSRLSV